MALSVLRTALVSQKKGNGTHLVPEYPVCPDIPVLTPDILVLTPDIPLLTLAILALTPDIPVLTLAIPAIARWADVLMIVR